MLDDALKRRILDSQFVNRLRLDAECDQELLAALCADLVLLAKQWRDDTQIDKELAWDLITQLMVVRNSADRLSLDRDSPIWDAYMELDRLILEEVFYVPEALRTGIPTPPTSMNSPITK